MAAALGQSKRLASFTTPAGQDVFSLLKFEAREALSELFVYQIEAVSTSRGDELQNLIGEKCHIKMTLKNGEDRIFNGILVEAQWLGRENDLDHYRFVLRPWPLAALAALGLPHLQEQDGDRHHQDDLRQGGQGELRGSRQ